MSSSHRSRRGLLASVAVGAVLLAGCAGPTNAPTTYDDNVQASFLATCTGNVGTVDNTTTTLASTTYCQCALAAYIANVPYDDNARNDSKYAGFPSDADTFSKMDSELKSNPAEPPDGAKKTLELMKPKLAECPKTGETTGTTPGSVPSGTVPGSTVPSGPAVPTTVS